MTDRERLSKEELDAEDATALPAKEVMSLLDLNADVDLALDLAAPVDLAVAANLNVAAPISAAASANVLSFGSDATAVADQGVIIEQTQSGEAIANAPQDSVIDQSDDTVDDGGTTVPLPDDGTGEVGDLVSGNLLDVNLDIDADLDAAAPIAGAVAANANIAAPIDAAVAANIASIDSNATAVAQQDAIITQDLDGVTAEATADQDSEITQ